MTTQPADADARIAELQERVAAAEAASRQDRQAVAMRDAVIGAISRELSNQLAPVMLAVERLRLLAAGGDAMRIASGLDLAERACLAFSRRSRSMLEFAELAGAMVASPLQAIDLSSIVRAAAASHADVARRAGCRFTQSVPAGMMAVGNMAGVEQVIEQLLANAFKYGAGRPVALSLRAGLDDHVVVSVRDEGPGIPESAAAGLFGRTGAAALPGAPGLGIGLWIAARWADAMGASLRLADSHGSGACFEFAVRMSHADREG